MVRSARDVERVVAERGAVICDDQPGDYYRRACRVCGSAVVGVSLRPARHGGPGGEVIRCVCGHLLGSKGWRVVPND